MRARPAALALLACVLAATHPAQTIPAAVEDRRSEDPGLTSLPLEIEINGVGYGEAIVRASPNLDIVELQGSTLKELARSVAADEALALIESLPDNYTSLAAIRANGIEIELDLERLVIMLTLPIRATSNASDRSVIQLGYQRRLNSDQHVPQARFSARANLRWSVARSESDGRVGTARSRLGIDHVFNVRGLAFEGESIWSPESGIELKEFRVTRDFPQRLWRASLGDISTAITDQQRGAQLFGASLVKEFGIEPYRVFTPTGSAAFELQEEATVNVSVNGRATRTLRLSPGQYSIEDFKLAAGPNSMTLEIRTDSGQVDALDVRAFGSLALLGRGVSTYALSAGFPRAYQRTEDTIGIDLAGLYKRYLDPEPMVSGYYRRGISNQVTAAADAQGSANWGRIGVALSTAGERLGEVDLSFSAHQANGHASASAARLRWRRELAGFDIGASASYSGRDYNVFSASESGAPRSIASTRSLSLSRLFAQRLNITASALEQTRYDGGRLRSATLNAGQRFGPVYASLSLRRNVAPEGRNSGAYLSLAWRPAAKWRSRSQIRYDRQAQEPEVSTSIDYSSRQGDAYSNGNLTLRRDEDGYGADAFFTRRTSRYSATVSHRETYDTIDAYSRRGRETSLALETALAYADGSFAMAERIRDGFVIIDRHPAWREAALGINPTYGGYEKTLDQARFFKPILPSLASYREGYATVQTIGSDLFLERNDYYFFPGYRRGTRLQIGDDAVYSVRSLLRYADGDPVAFRAIQLRSGDGRFINTFTNSAGRFIAIGLRPGAYRIFVADSDETARIEVREDADILTVLDAIQLSPP